jgi:Stage II sporulation protein E (SpoIIE)
MVAGGHASYLNDGRSAPLGFGDVARPEAQLTALSGAMLILYSDGLIERRKENIDRGLDRLAALAASLTGTDAQHWSDSLLTGMTDGQIISDDVVVARLHLRGEHNGGSPSPNWKSRTRPKAAVSSMNQQRELRTVNPACPVITTNGALAPCQRPDLSHLPP